MRRAVIALTAVLGGVVVMLGFGATSAWAQEEQALRGTLRSQGQPVAGVKIDVTTEAGTTVGTTTSAADGTWQVDVPEAGTYKVTIDVNTLPSGVTLRNPDRTTLTVQVFSGNIRNIQFPFGAPTGGGGPGQPTPSGAASKWDRVPQLVYDGLFFGVIIALAALGLSLIYGTTGLVNFAHGELVTFGALMAFFFNFDMTVFGISKPGVHLIPAVILGVIVAGAVGWAQDRYFWGWLRRRGSGLIAMMIISIGVGIFLRNLFQWRFGPEPESFAQYVAQRGVDIGPVTASPKNLIGLGIGVVVLVAVSLALLRTRMGKATRAVADDPALAASSGIDVERVIRLVWTVGAALAGYAGIVLALQNGVTFRMGQQVLLLVFAGVTLGGLGTAFGAMVGSLIVGLVMSLSTLWIPVELQTVTALGVLILILLVRPQGILGRRERVG